MKASGNRRGRPPIPETEIAEGWLDGAQRRFLSHGFEHGSAALKDLLARCKQGRKRGMKGGPAGLAREWATDPTNWPSGYSVVGTWLEGFAALALRHCRMGYPPDHRALLLMPRASSENKPPPTYTFNCVLVRHWTPRFQIRIIRGRPREIENYYHLRHTLEEFAEKTRNDFNDALCKFVVSTRELESKRLRSSTRTKLLSTQNDDLELAARYYLCNETVESLGHNAAHKESSVVRKRISRVLRLLNLESRAPGRPRRK